MFRYACYAAFKLTVGYQMSASVSLNVFWGCSLQLVLITLIYITGPWKKTDTALSGVLHLKLCPCFLLLYPFLACHPFVFRHSVTKIHLLIPTPILSPLSASSHLSVLLAIFYSSFTICTVSFFPVLQPPSSVLHLVAARSDVRNVTSLLWSVLWLAPFCHVVRD